MAKVIQFSSSVLGDNVNSEQQMITTVLYDDGRIFEGYMKKTGKTCETTGASYDVTYKMHWDEVELPDLRGDY